MLNKNPFLNQDCNNNSSAISSNNESHESISQSEVPSKSTEFTKDIPVDIPSTQNNINSKRSPLLSKYFSDEEMLLYKPFTEDSFLYDTNSQRPSNDNDFNSQNSNGQNTEIIKTDSPKKQLVNEHVVPSEVCFSDENLLSDQGNSNLQRNFSVDELTPYREDSNPQRNFPVDNPLPYQGNSNLKRNFSDDELIPYQEDSNPQRSFPDDDPLPYQQPPNPQRNFPDDDPLPYQQSPNPQRNFSNHDSSSYQGGSNRNFSNDTHSNYQGNPNVRNHNPSISNSYTPQQRTYVNTLSNKDRSNSKSKHPHKRLYNYFFALFGGFFGTLFSALLWAGVTYYTGYKHSVMCLGVSIIVAFFVRTSGKGYNFFFSFVGGLFSLAGCLLWKIFTIYIDLSNEMGIEITKAALSFEYPLILDILEENFHSYDLLFYVMALYIGLKHSLSR